MKNIVEISDPKYPPLLKKIDQPPEKFYYKGNWNAALFEKCLAVVGSRKMTSYGRQITAKLVSEIAAAGITIVSGFMYGIDATAHKAALAAGGKTIAVMPCGIDLIHPEYQADLYKEILKNDGLIISEFEGAFPPALWTYPKRNRIVAGLSLATMVIEAGQKSGSLITAGLTEKYKRKLFAVPGQLTSTQSKGTLRLIKAGASIVTCAQDILAAYGISNHKISGEKLRSSNLNKLERNIVEKLQQEPMRIDALSRLLEVTASEIGTSVSLMQLKGFLFEEEGKYYVN
ncbi:MAG: DNA-processing protein DprA [Candidatus Omnitrophica bacterium]|nr:DNA-processing protein DprA [Candidatus Omnitrophota bacterium]